MRKILKYIFLTGAIFYTFAASAQVKVMASINKRVVSVNESLNFQVTVEGSQNASTPRFEKLSGLKVIQGPSVSTQMSFINGRQSKSVTYSYLLKPKIVGAGTIGPVSVVVGNRKYRTKPIKVQIVKGSAKNSDPGTEGLNADDNIFLNLQVDKNDVYVNGQLSLALTLYYKDTDITDVTQPNFNNKSFFVYDDGNRPLQQRVMIDNVIYNSVRFQKLLIPLTAGRHKLGPFSVDVTIRIRTRRRSRDPFDDDFFGGSFFGDVFGSYKTKVITVKSNPVTINVKNLPAGQPDDYNGAVGSFSLKASVSPKNVHAGEPVTLTVELVGKGNIDNVSVDLPKTVDGFRIYEPESSRNTRISDGELVGKRTYKLAMVPTSTEATTIPAITFSYFDPETKKYVSLKKGPFKLTVKPSTGSERIKITELAPVKSKGGSIRILNQDIFPIKTSGSSLGIINRATSNPLFYSIIIAPAMCWLALAILARRRERLLTDTALYRRANASKNVKLRFKNAVAALNKNDGKNFYSELSDALTNFIADKIHIPAPQVTANSVSKMLSERGVSKNVINQVKDILEFCDFGRFASADFSKKAAKEKLNECKKLITVLDKQIITG